MEKILSVSIAAYNVEKTLREALDPFLSEGIREYVDVMIVNDGSKDSTPDIALEYQNMYPDTFRLINKENGGWGSTLNVGMKNARGKYFKQLDGDDFFSHENLADFIQFLKKTDADFVQSPFLTFEDGTGAIIREWGLYEGDYRFFPFDKTVAIDECDGLVPAMHSTTVKTTVLRDNNVEILEHCFYTDVEFVLKAFNSCKTAAFYERTVYWYRLARDGQSMSQTGVRKHYKDHFRMLKTMIEYYNNNVQSDFAKKVVANRLDGVCNMMYIFFFALECTAEQKKELREYDKWLHDNAPDFYYRVKGRQVNLLRKTNFFGYKLVSAQKMRKDKRLKRNIFEGN